MMTDFTQGEPLSVHFVIYDVDGNEIPHPSPPTVDELLATAADESTPLARRMQAADEAAWGLRRQLERACLHIFPDFYWSGSRESGAFSSEGADYVCCRLPQARHLWDFDAELTPERDAALCALGFTHCGGELLGTTSTTEARTCSAVEDGEGCE